MAKKLIFRYGAMNSSKSTALLQVAFNYKEREMRAIIAKPETDTKSENISSRIGIENKIDWIVTEKDNFLDFLEMEEKTFNSKIHCILVDESQFLSVEQINQLFEIAVIKNIPVICYGLRTDFQTNAFPGSQRLLEIAHSLEEIKTICRCGSKAIFNGRKINEVFVSQGNSIAIDGEDNVDYESLCGVCFFEKVGNISE